MNLVNVCRKDRKKSDMDTVSFNRNLFKKSEHKIVILEDSHTRSLTGSLEGKKSQKKDKKKFNTEGYPCEKYRKSSTAQPWPRF